ncbi:hypothetical protein [Paenibacillus turpanensis]|uniref:hypothetical protein n=1 Tax=Paenibacillus turpanensis TaxID=2689078 RepID=UPI00140D2AFF|nr:hypothetical protein [Paenibacillus turpanensis]
MWCLFSGDENLFGETMGRTFAASINLGKRIELELRQVDYDTLFGTFGAEPGITSIAGDVTTQGWKTKLAKEVAQ